MQKTITHTALCLLEELNDILSKGELAEEVEKDLEKIIYNCKLLIDITE
tara:strand:- start:1435 stop:1581 length:147 start_codon:yes stop_codon:yes gene_type:complete